MTAPIPSHASLPLEQLEVTPPDDECAGCGEHRVTCWGWQRTHCTRCCLDCGHGAAPEREAPPRTGKWSLDWCATSEHMRKAFARTVDDAVPESALIRRRP